MSAEGTGGMKVFLSYASEDRELAEEIQLALLGADHVVFFDKSSLPPAGDYNARIEKAVKDSDAFVYLISPHSVAKGSYALTELKYARLQWPHPKGHVLPLRLHDTPWETIPAYLKSVTVLEPEGSAAAETVAALSRLGRRRHRFWAGLALCLGIVLLAAWAIFDHYVSGPGGSSTAAGSAQGSGIAPPGPAAGRANPIPAAPASPGEAKPPRGEASGGCVDVPYTDYSKMPPETQMIRQCD